MNLPFLKHKGVPKLRKQVGESRYGFSEDEEMIEHAIDELIAAKESKDSHKFIEALKALIHCIKNREAPHADIHA